MCRRRVEWTVAARADLHEVNAEDAATAQEAVRVSTAVERCQLDGVQLQHFRKTGDLTDCYNIKVGTHHDPPSHRLVYRFTDQDSDSEVPIDVVALLPRGCVYQATGVRLGRLFGAAMSDASRFVHRMIGRNP